MQESLPATLIADSAAAALMAAGKLDAIVVGADRIAANGDTANKIGTYSLAVAAKHHGCDHLEWLLWNCNRTITPCDTLCANSSNSGPTRGLTFCTAVASAGQLQQNLHSLQLNLNLSLFTGSYDSDAQCYNHADVGCMSTVRIGSRSSLRRQ